MERQERIIAVFDLTEEPKKRPRTIVISDSESDDEIPSTITTQQSSDPQPTSRTEETINQRQSLGSSAPAATSGSSELTRELEPSRPKQTNNPTLPVSTESPAGNRTVRDAAVNTEMCGPGPSRPCLSNITEPTTSSGNQPASEAIFTTNVTRGPGVSRQSSSVTTDTNTPTINRLTGGVIFTTNVPIVPGPSTQQTQARRKLLSYTPTRPEAPQTNQASLSARSVYSNFLPTEFETPPPRIQLNSHPNKNNNSSGTVAVRNASFQRNKSPNQSTRQYSNLIEVPTNAFASPRPAKQRIAHVPKKFAGPDRNPEPSNQLRTGNASSPTLPLSVSSLPEPGPSRRQAGSSPQSAVRKFTGSQKPRRLRQKSTNTNETQVNESARPPRKQEAVKPPERAVATTSKSTRKTLPKPTTISSSESDVTTTKKKGRPKKQSTCSAQSRITSTVETASPATVPVSSSATSPTQVGTPTTPPTQITSTQDSEVILESEDNDSKIKKVKATYEQFTGLELTAEKLDQIIKYVEENPELRNIVHPNAQTGNNNENSIGESEPMEVQQSVENSLASESQENPESVAPVQPPQLKLKIAVKNNRFSVISNTQDDTQNPKPNKRGRKKGSKNKKKNPENVENEDVGNQQTANASQPSTSHETIGDQSVSSTVSNNDNDNCAKEDNWEDVDEDPQESLPRKVKVTKAQVRRDVSKYLEKSMIQQVFVSPVKPEPVPRELVNDNQISEPALDIEYGILSSPEYFGELVLQCEEEEPMIQENVNLSYIESLSQVVEIDHRRFVPPLICYICQQQFFTTRMYITHVNSHPERREFRCECNLFVERDEILDHFDTMHAIGHYQCSCCSFGTIHSKLICQHILREHPNYGKMAVLRETDENQDTEEKQETVAQLIVRPIVEFEEFLEIVNAEKY